MALLASFPVTSLSISKISYQRPRIYSRRLLQPLASLNSSSSSSSSSRSSSSPSSSSHESSSSVTLPPNKASFVDSAQPNVEKDFNHALATPSGNPVVRFVQSTESSIERVKKKKTLYF